MRRRPIAQRQARDRQGPRECEDDGCDYPAEITVPKDHLFLLGDNRGASDDSRFWGPVPEDWLIAKLWCIYKDGS